MYTRLGDTVLEKMGSGSTERKKQGLLQGLAFFMGNALVVGVIEKIGLALSQKINKA